MGYHDPNPSAIVTEMPDSTCSVRWSTALTLAAALLISGCGGVDDLAGEALERAAEAGGGGQVDVEFGEDGAPPQIEIESDELSLSVGSDLEPPDELSIPTPEDGEVTTVANADSSVSVAIQYPLERFDEIVVFYEDWTTQDEREWSRSETSLSTDDGTVRNVHWIAGSSFIGVSNCYTVDTDGYDAVCLSITESN